MNKFLFLLEKKDILSHFFIYNLFPIQSNHIDDTDELLPKDYLTIQTYWENNEFFRNVKEITNFTYNKNEVDVVTYNRWKEKDLYKFVKKFQKAYDGVFIFYFNAVSTPIHLSNYNNIFIETDEVVSFELIKLLENPYNKILTSGKKEGFRAKNYYFNHKLAFHYFYYLLGFYHLNIKKLNVEKENLLGTYLKKGYRQERDDLYFDIESKFKNKKEFENYSFTFENDLALALDLKYNLGWMKNHISSFTDYIRSLFILNFETDSPDVTNTHHLTEKSIKSILFSKLNIPSIMYAHQEILINLKNDGFWFLNFDYLDFDELKDWESKKDDEYGAKLVKNSVLKSVDFILELDKKFKGNKKEIENYIVENYSDKLQNNYKLFKNILNDIDIKEEVFNTITKNYKKWHNQNTHLI